MTPGAKVTWTLDLSRVERTINAIHGEFAWVTSPHTTHGIIVLVSQLRYAKH